MDPIESSDFLVDTLLVEVLQAERSGAMHARREAVRLGDTPAAHAMAAIAEDCVRSLSELRAVDAERPQRAKLGGARFGELIGAAISQARAHSVDLLLTREASYRATLVGVHHGVDAMALLRVAAEDANDGALLVWSLRALARRTVLIENAENELAWFGRHSSFATAPAQGTLLARAVRLVARAFAITRVH